MICLDSHVLLWWTLDQEKLSEGAAELCRRMEREAGYASAISIWELGWKIRAGRLEIGMSIEKFVSLIKEGGQLIFVPVDEDVWLTSLALPWEHRDPADRAIVATARKMGVPLLTSDGHIRDFLGDRAIW